MPVANPDTPASPSRLRKWAENGAIFLVLYGGSYGMLREARFLQIKVSNGCFTTLAYQGFGVEESPLRACLSHRRAPNWRTAHRLAGFVYLPWIEAECYWRS